MASGNQVVSRLKQQRSRIQGMLSPGRKNVPGGDINVPLSPVASDFAGRKFQIAAKKMRILGEDRTRSFLPRMEMTLGADIASKFKDVEKNFHVNSQTMRDSSIWSEVETIFPGGGQPTSSTMRPDPGHMLQQGSVIQKYSTVPKPGQSLESFRQQIESQPRVASPSVTRNKKAAISPGDRLFSKVQEITAGQKSSGQGSLEVAVPPEKPVEKRAPKVEPFNGADKPTIQKQTESTAMVQRQIDQPVVKEQPEEAAKGRDKEATVEIRELRPGSEVLAQENKPEVRERAPVSEVPVQESNAEIEARASVSEVPAQENMPKARESAPISEISAQENQPETAASALVKLPPSISAPVAPPVQKALPVEQKPEQKRTIKKAMPVKNEKGAVKKPIVTKARPVVQSTVQREEAADVQQQASSSLKPKPVEPVAVARVSQHAPTEAATNAEKLQSQSTQAVPPGAALPKKFEAPDMPIMLPKQDVDSAPVVEEDIAWGLKTDVSEIEQEKEAGLVMPLRQVLAERRQSAVRAIRRVEPVKSKQGQSPMLTHFPVPMIASQKNNSNVVSRAMEDMPAARQVLPTFRAGGPQSISTRISTPSVGFQTLSVAESETEQALLEMPVAVREAIASQAKAPDKPEIKEKFKQQPVQNLREAPAIPRTTNIVQRQWEEHTGVEGQSSGGASSQAAGDDREDSSLDLEALAEDVFPFVKRILEIEMDRGSGKFR